MRPVQEVVTLARPVTIQSSRLPACDLDQQAPGQGKTAPKLDMVIAIRDINSDAHSGDVEPMEMNLEIPVPIQEFIDLFLYHGIHGCDARVARFEVVPERHIVLPPLKFFSKESPFEIYIPAARVNAVKYGTISVEFVVFRTTIELLHPLVDDILGAQADIGWAVRYVPASWQKMGEDLEAQFSRNAE